jgi:hypothetical protein
MERLPELNSPWVFRSWQLRYNDFAVWSEKKMIEKLRYMHRGAGPSFPNQHSSRLLHSSRVLCGRVGLR